MGRETLMGERNIASHMHPDHGFNLQLFGVWMMLQPAEPPGQGITKVFIHPGLQPVRHFSDYMVASTTR